MKLTLSIQEGGRIRNALERLRGGKTVLTKDEGDNTKPAVVVLVEKRPIVYSWIYADDDICVVTEGTSGSLAALRGAVRSWK
jgi:hypothetical protein